MKLIEQHQIFGGLQQVWAHYAQTLQCEMKFAVYLPNNPENRPLGVIYWLSGLTCTEQNFITKSGFQRYAAEHQVIVVAPDTSPRGEQVPNDAAYDLGQGAGFYLNATEQPWVTNYQMYDYILNELPRACPQFNLA
ncbi:putative esterase [Neisseria meningitidis]|nr:putative esterase [Neisseria meningitidis]CWT72535.1 putative esterase [Neisseria meningitidis]